MVIYIDVFIFTNTIINYCILCVVKKFLLFDTKTYRLIISSFIASLFSLLVLFKDLSFILSLSIKLMCTVMMCFIAFRFTNISSFIKSIFITYIVSIFFSGAMIFIHSTFKPSNMAIINDNVYFNIKPLTLIIISILIYLLVLLLQRIFSDNFGNTLVNLKIVIGGYEYSCVGKIDTGCSVTEPFSNAPVIITESSIVNLDTIKQCNRIIPYTALGISSTLAGIKADKIYIDKKLIDKEVYIGVYQKEIDKTIKAIINSNILR